MYKSNAGTELAIVGLWIEEIKKPTQMEWSSNHLAKTIEGNLMEYDNELTNRVKEEMDLKDEAFIIDRKRFHTASVTFNKQLPMYMKTIYSE